MPSIELLAEVQALRAENKALRMDCVGTMIGQREMYLTNENAVLVAMVQGMQAELAALKKDARICTEALLSMKREAEFWIRDDIEEAASRIIEATKEVE